MKYYRVVSDEQYNRMVCAKCSAEMLIGKKVFSVMSEFSDKKIYVEAIECRVCALIMITRVKAYLIYAFETGKIIAPYSSYEFPF